MDLFAAAIILFIMVSQRPPFHSADPTDPHYQMIAAGRSDLFWKAHREADGNQDLYSAEFKDFFEKMMCLNPKHRLNMDQVLKHAWMQGDRSTPVEIKKEFTDRKTAVDLQIQRDQEEKRS